MKIKSNKLFDSTENLPDSSAFTFSPLALGLSEGLTKASQVYYH